MFCYGKVVILLALFGWARSDRIGAICESNWECSNIIDAECAEGVCSCISGTTLYKGGCIQSAEPEASCVTDVDCKIVTDPRRICVEGLCRCLPIHHVLNGTCIKNKGLREPCISDEECFWGQNLAEKMECDEILSVCVCKTGYRPIGGRQCVSNDLILRGAFYKFLDKFFG